MRKASLLDRVRARAPAYWPLIREEPLWAVMFALSRINAARKIERFISSADFKKPIKVSNTAFPGLDLEKVVATLVDEGVYTGLHLSQTMVNEIREFADAHPVFTKDKPEEGFLPGNIGKVDGARERDVLAAYYFETAKQCPAVMELRDDETFYSIASAYLGQPAILMRTRLWWSFPATRISDGDLHLAAQNRFHFDIDGWRTLKFFFYLTPTDEEGGPHQYIRGSHQRRKLSHQFTPTTGRPTPDLQGFYGPDEFVTITGGEGFGFAEDPFVFHTGTRCQTKPRLMLEIGFGVSAANPAYKKPDFIYGRLG
jgi:hypothetical protein